MKITWTRTALKGLKRLPAHQRSQVIETMEALAADPFAPDNNIKPLKGLTDAYRRRFGDLRVSYTLDRDAQTLTVYEVAPRGKAYR